MSRTNFDASQTTARRRQLALYAWRQSNTYPENPTSSDPEQQPSRGNKGNGPTMDVGVSASLGALLVGQSPPNDPWSPCGCNPNVTLQGDVKNSPAK